MCETCTGTYGSRPAQTLGSGTLNHLSKNKNQKEELLQGHLQAGVRQLRVSKQTNKQENISKIISGGLGFGLSTKQIFGPTLKGLQKSSRQVPLCLAAIPNCSGSHCSTDTFSFCTSSHRPKPGMSLGRKAGREYKNSHSCTWEMIENIWRFLRRKGIFIWPTGEEEGEIKGNQLKWNDLNVQIHQWPPG